MYMDWHWKACPLLLMFHNDIAVCQLDIIIFPISYSRVTYSFKPLANTWSHSREKCDIHCNFSKFTRRSPWIHHVSTPCSCYIHHKFTMNARSQCIHPWIARHSPKIHRKFTENPPKIHHGWLVLMKLIVSAIVGRTVAHRSYRDNIWKWTKISNGESEQASGVDR